MKILIPASIDTLQLQGRYLILNPATTRVEVATFLGGEHGALTFRLNIDGTPIVLAEESIPNLVFEMRVMHAF